MNDFTLIIGNKNYSSWSMRPWILMKHAGIPFDEVVIPLYQADSKEKILHYSAAGKVPTLKHGNFTVWDSIAICEYLADLFPKKNLWPIDVRERAHARSIAAEMHAGFTSLRTNCPMDVRSKKTPKANTPELSKDIDRVKEIWESCRRQHKGRGDFLFGPFTVADAMYAPVVWRFNTYGIELNGETSKYFQTMLNLPEMREWQAAAIKEPWVIEF